MDVAATLSVVQTLSAAAQCAKLKEVCSFLGKKPELDAFSNTVSDIKVLLLAVMDKQEVSHDVLLLLEELKDAVYDADDLLDEFVTIFGEKRLVEDGRVSEEVSLFFPRFDPLFVADNLGKRVKNIKEKLKATVSENDGFKYDVDFLPVRRRWQNTCSYVCENDVIGRDVDLTNIVGMLLDSKVQHDVSVLGIVGVEGVGKTALARLLYDDERVVKTFPLRLWTCVSDLDQEEFNVDEIIRKIVRSATDQKHNGSEMDQVYDQLMELIEGRKYLLVLEDVWTENREQWLKLVEVLKVGQSGSRILVTTRSRGAITETIRDCAIYELQGLSEENSWRLFEKTAFDDAIPSVNLVKIGQEIVKRCNNIPLSIRLVGSLLYGQDDSTWLSFQEYGFTKIRPGSNDIKPVLKLCYDHLKPELQSCLSFCAVFPKDFEIQKDLLIILWISQGFVVPLEESQSIEDAAEEYFSILLQRWFFHDVKKDEYGEIVSCKIHDLLHEFAREIHFSGKTRIRTFFQVGRMNQIPLNQLLETCNSLRTLVLRDSDIKTLPNSINKLLHLRCIDLSDNPCLEMLPNSITNLYNLQTLILRSCINLKELPKDLSRLVNLTVLDIAYCYRLAYVPSDLHKLIRLHTLSDYKVCVASSSSSECLDQLQGLKALVNLKGNLWLKLWFPRNAAYVKEDGVGDTYLKNKEHLKHIRFDIQHSQGDGAGDYETVLLEDLQPHSNLQGVVFSGYSSIRFPSWVREDNFSTVLPNLVRLEFVRCTKLQHLPWLGKLYNLKFLSLFDLPNLEYVETNPAGVQSGFPCLEDLRLSGLPKLKGFRNEIVEDDLPEDSSSSTKRRTKRMTRVKTRKPDQLSSLYLPQLKSLQIRECVELTSTIHCPRVEEMTLRIFNKKLSVKIASDPDVQKHLKLQSVITDNTTWLNSISTEAFHCLSHICIYWDKELESLSEVEGIFRSCSFSLKHLEICHCPKLTSLSGGLEHLSVLETLVLEYIANLHWTNSKDEGNQWQSLHQSLRSLELLSLPKIVNLPRGMQYLTSLRSLRISDCDELKSMPKWVSELVSLKKLDIQGCPHLSERYENFMGKDWPNTEHIRDVSVRW
ncbi:putative disease resistance protein RGA1 [Silene latifolia]|uniref:putative disease resistance protein RGA1 n=1 Tax=Silene latifolia TaxID=37657 RepID=UPI003D78191C